MTVKLMGVCSGIHRCKELKMIIAPRGRFLLKCEMHLLKYLWTWVPSIEIMEYLGALKFLVLPASLKLYNS